MNDLEYYHQALKDDPSGNVCSFCGKDNDFWDDCGWFYIKPTVTIVIEDEIIVSQLELGPCCKACWKGPLGQSHIKRYGLSER